MGYNPTHNSSSTGAAAQVTTSSTSNTASNPAAAAATPSSATSMSTLTDNDKDEHMIVFVEDPTAPSRSQRKTTTTTSTTLQQQSLTDNSHTRWTCCVLGTQQPSASSTFGLKGSNVAALTSGSSSSSSTPLPPPPPTQLITPFDAFLQRVLLGANNTAANNATPVEGQWTPRTTAVSLEGFVFHVGADRAAGSGVGDWQVKVASVVVKGGANSGTMRGVIVEATYLAVPYLPPKSDYVRNFLASLFPAHNVANGEVRFIEPDQDGMYEAGILSQEQLESGYDWDWQEKHIAWMYVDLLKQEGLL